MRIESLTPEIVIKYKKEITQFYYDNLRACSCLEHFSFEEAAVKIEEKPYLYSLWPVS